MWINPKVNVIARVSSNSFNWRLQAGTGVITLSYLADIGGARGVMVIVAGNGHGDTSSTHGRDWLHFT